jgi:hypothetical protein
MGALARPTRDRPDPGGLMSAREVRIEVLLGALVRDPAGRRVGRIEEIRAVPDGDGLVVTHDKYSCADQETSRCARVCRSQPATIASPATTYANAPGTHMTRPPNC